HRRIGHGRPGDGNQLPLALAQIGPVSGKHGLVAVRQTPNETVGVGQLRGGNTFFVSGVQSSVTDVVHDGSGKEVGVLENDSQRAAQIRLPDFVDIDAVVADFAIL